MGCWLLWAPAVVVLMSSSYSYMTQPNGPAEMYLKTTRMERCPKGTFLSPASCQSLGDHCRCVECPSGYYQKDRNLDDSCQPCTYCQANFELTEVKPCMATQDRECGCKPGYYKEPQPYSEFNGFDCKKCRNCSATHQEAQQDCSQEADAVCGACLPTFCESGGQCQPCPSEMPGACGKACQSVLGSCAFLLLLVGGLTVYCKRSRYVGLQPPLSPTSLSISYRGKPSSGSQHLETILPMDGGRLPCPVLQPGRKLYTIIDAVPVRRWKEFVRGLGLRDGEIELVELEHSQFREQQYEMLKCWSQRRGACLESALAVLEEMQLGGCAQELREQLEPKTHPFHPVP